MDSDGSHYESEKQQYLPYFYHGSSGVGGRHHEMATPPQYGLLVFNMDDHPNIDAHEPIMLITNAPNSTFIYADLPELTPGKAGNPVAALVFHYDLESSGSVAEAAHLASLGIKVNVLVAKSGQHHLRTAYNRALQNSENLSIESLELRSRDLSFDRMNKSEGKVLLYMDVILQVLRQMANENDKGKPFSYKPFLQLLKTASEKFTPQQSNPMHLRLNLLESFMPGTLTIVDLSDPFVDAATVCVLFDICLTLVKENMPSCGLVVALDEAHKYLNSTVAAGNFTDRLLATIREKRHNATRVIIATKEPTRSEKLLDFCSVSGVHRFTSPAWFSSVKEHIGGASALLAHPEEQKKFMEKIVCLGTGESLVFSPSSYLVVADGVAKKLASGMVRMMTRLRVGEDGGQSKMSKAADGVDGITGGMAAALL